VVGKLWGAPLLRGAGGPRIVPPGVTGRASIGAGRAAATVVVALLLLAFGVGAAVAAPAPMNAGLTVTSGSYKVVKGRLVGSAKVANKASRATGIWYASLVAQLPRGVKLLRRGQQSTIQAGESKTLRLAATLPEGLPAGRLPVWFCARRSPWRG
jgi:hypothetical protein